MRGPRSIEYYFQFLSKHTKSIMVTYLLPNLVDRLLSVEVEGGSSLAVEEGDRVRRARASLRREREFAACWLSGGEKFAVRGVRKT